MTNRSPILSSKVVSRPDSSWRELLAACSLPGVLAAPLAVLHNLPWVPFTGPDEALPYELAAQRWVEFAWPFEVALGAALATIGSAVIQSRMLARQSPVRLASSAVNSRLVDWLPDLGPALIRAAKTLPVLALTWVAAVIGGCLVLVLGAFSLGLWSGILKVLASAIIVASLASSGIFYLTGIPCAISPRLRSVDAVPSRFFAIWMIFAASLGGCGFAVLLQALFAIGVGFRGPYLIVFVPAVYFAWGSGIAAYLIHRWLRR